MRGGPLGCNPRSEANLTVKQGRFDPALPLAFRLARTFDCSIEDLFTPEAWHPRD